jgi:hypothetical protein
MISGGISAFTNAELNECEQWLRTDQKVRIFSEFLGKSIEFYKKTISEYKSSGQYLWQNTKSKAKEDPNFNACHILLNSLSTRIGDLYRYKKNFKVA